MCGNCSTADYPPAGTGGVYALSLQASLHPKPRTTNHKPYSWIATVPRDCELQATVPSQDQPGTLTP